MQIRLTLWCILFLCVFTAMPSAISQVYKTTHKDGSVSYSDKPSPGAVEVSLDVNTTTIQSRTLKPIITTQEPSNKMKHVVNINSPENDATVRNNAGEINIVATIAPQLEGLFKLHFSGDTYESPSGIFRLIDIPRGAHSYYVEFLDNSGKVIALSDSRTLYLHKASVSIN